jgi:hypothetical protein
MISAKNQVRRSVWSIQTSIRLVVATSLHPPQSSSVKSFDFQVQAEHVSQELPQSGGNLSDALLAQIDFTY